MALDLNLQRGDSTGNNAVRIPVLNQTKTVDRLPNSPRMQPAQISNDIGRALSGMGGALGDASKAAYAAEAGDMRIQELEVQQEKEKQTLAAQKAVSESSLALMTYFDEAQGTAKPGAAGFTQSLTKGIDEHIASATKDATPYYKQTYERNMISTRQHLLSKAQDYEFGEGLKLEVSNVNQGVEGSQKLVYADPALLEQELGRWGSTIDANSRFNPEAKRQMKESVRKQLVWAAGAKEIEGNPAEWNATLNPYSPRKNANGGMAGAMTHDGLPARKNADGSYSTEVSITVTDPRLNEGKPTNIPSLWGGKEVDEETAVKNAIKSGNKYKSFDSINEAVESAKARSNAGGAGSGGFDSVMTHIFKKEGGYNADDGNGSPVNFGINQGANPDIDVKNLTKEKAAQIYKQRYWDAIGGDNLSPGVALMAMDAAVNQGVGFAKDMLAKSGGDINEMAAMRRDRYEEIIQKNPSKAKYAKVWEDRVASALKQAGADVVITPLSPDGTAQNTGRVKIGAPWYDLATFDEQQKFRQYADQKFNQMQTELNKERQNLASGLELETRNITEMVSRGVAPEGQPRTLGDFQAAYQNPERAAQAYAGYQTAWDTAQTTSRFNGMPTQELAQVMREPAPAATDPDFAVKSNFQQVRQNAAVQIMAARQKDPWAYAQATKDFNAGIADPSKPDFADVIKQRAAALPQLMQKYGVTTPNVLTEAEASVIGERMAQLPADDRIKTLKTLRGAIADDGVYANLLNTLRPDSPVTVLAGNIAAVGGTVRVGGEAVSTDKIASRIARGEDLLNPRGADKKSDGGKGAAFPMPKEPDMRLQWTTEVGTAYAGFPDAEAHAYQAYRAYYAARAAEKGLTDGTVNQDIQNEAITAATGGIGKLDPNGLMNSYRVILPYGMAQDEFQDKAAVQWKSVGPANGYARTTIDDVRLRPTGENGRYLVTGPDQLALPGKDGNPIILDMLAAPGRVAGQSQSGTIRR